MSSATWASASPAVCEMKNLLGCHLETPRCPIRLDMDKHQGQSVPVPINHKAHLSLSPDREWLSHIGPLFLARHSAVFVSRRDVDNPNVAIAFFLVK